MLSGRIERNMSVREPCFKYLVEKPAYGPKSRCRCPSMIRVSRCGTDIGGAPNAALPYTLASWRFVTRGLSARIQMPLTGNPAYPSPSGIPDFWSNGSAPPPAPRNDRLRHDRAARPLAHIPRVHAPPAVALALQVDDAVGEVRREASSRAEVPDEVRGQRTEVHVRPGDHPRGGDHVVRVAPIHDERNPFGELVLVLRVLHSAVAVMRGERRVPLLEEGDVVGTAYEAHVRHGVEEGLRGLDGSPLHEDAHSWRERSNSTLT